MKRICTQVNDLRKELESRSLSSKGLKSQLIARLTKQLKVEEQEEESKEPEKPEPPIVEEDETCRVEDDREVRKDLRILHTILNRIQTWKKIFPSGRGTKAAGRAGTPAQGETLCSARWAHHYCPSQLGCQERQIWLQHHVLECAAGLQTGG